MAKNTLPILPEVRQPRGAIKINGEAVAGWLTWETDENEFAQPDTFTATFAMSLLPEDKGAAWFASQTKLEVELFVGFPTDPSDFSADDLESMFIGTADDPSFDWVEGVISLTGRDATAKLMDRKISEKNVNVTASDIATKLAGAAGLKPKVTETKTKVGKYYQTDNVDLSVERTEWDLLTWLAREEGFRVYVSGKALVFEPRPDEGQDPYVVQYTPAADSKGYATASISGLRTGMSMTAAKGVKVTVRTWNTKRKKAFTRTASRGGSDPQTFTYTIANLTPEQAEAKAKQILEEISRHARTLDFDGAADNLLRISDVIKLQGTGTDFDQVYYPQSIRRTLHHGGGYSWEVSAKNKTPESEAGNGGN